MTSGLDCVSVVSSAEEPAVVVKVHEIGEKVFALAALEAVGVPRPVRPGAGGHHANISAFEAPGALQNQITITFYKTPSDSRDRS